MHARPVHVEGPEASRGGSRGAGHDDQVRHPGAAGDPPSGGAGPRHEPAQSADAALAAARPVDDRGSSRHGGAARRRRHRAEPPGIAGFSLAAERARGPEPAFLLGDEFAHVHPMQDSSLHMTLPPAARLPGRRRRKQDGRSPHPIAGHQTISTVLVLAPRDAAELCVVTHLLSKFSHFARGHDTRLKGSRPCPYAVPNGPLDVRRNGVPLSCSAVEQDQRVTMPRSPRTSCERGPRVYRGRTRQDATKARPAGKQRTRYTPTGRYNDG